MSKSIHLQRKAATPSHAQKSYAKGAASYIPKERLSDIATYLNDILEAEEKGKSLWWRWLDRLEAYFDKRFGSNSTLFPVPITLTQTSFFLATRYRYMFLFDTQRHLPISCCLKSKFLFHYFHSAEVTCRGSSSPRELPPQALTEPYV
ncbi:MAG: hypothetical protein ACLFUP_10385, partial [Desulfobacteraceae bacterium]